MCVRVCKKQWLARFEGRLRRMACDPSSHKSFWLFHGDEKTQWLWHFVSAPPNAARLYDTPFVIISVVI